MKRVVVTGLGLVTPVGNNTPDTWKSLLEAKSGVSRITYFDPTNFDSQISGQVKNFDPSRVIPQKEVKRTDKFVHYALVAADEAIKDAGLNLAKEDLTRIGVLVGSGIGSLDTIERECKTYFEKGPSRISPFLIPTLIVNEAAGHVSIHFGLKGPNSCVATACASGSHAIGDAFRILQYGDAEVMVTGGTEGCITAMGIGGFCALKGLSKRNHEPQKASRPFDKQRDGFVMAEGSGIVVLETLDHAQKRKAKIYAEVAGYAMTSDAFHITAPDPEGDGPLRAMKGALTDAKLNLSDINYINSHGTSTLLNDKVETLAIKKLFGQYAKKIPVNSTKSMTGHPLGAAGGIEFVVCCLSIRDSLIHPTINLEYPDPDCDLDYVPKETRKVKVDTAMSNSLGFGGHNATLIVKRFTK